MVLTKKEKAGLGLAGIAAVGGVAAYGIYQLTSDSGLITSCKNAYAQKVMLWYATMQEYMKEDAKLGIALTQAQQSNLSYLQSQAENQLNQCAKLAKTTAGALTVIADDIGYALIIFATITGISTALKILKATGRSPKRPKQPPTSSQMFAYMTPLITQQMLDNKTINSENAQAFSSYLENVLEPYLQAQNSAEYNYYVELDIITAAAAVILISEAAAIISEAIDIAIGVAIAVA